MVFLSSNGGRNGDAGGDDNGEDDDADNSYGEDTVTTCNRACFKKNSSLHILAENFTTTFFRISAYRFHPEICHLISKKI